MKTPPSRTPTTLAVGFLALDAVLLMYAGITWGRPILVVAGALCVLGVVLVIAGWRRYRRTLAELDAARHDMKQEVDSIRELLQGHHLNN
jgi:hypothetical protein